MVDMFYTVMLQLIDYHFPISESKQMSNDKPWVNDRYGNWFVHVNQPFGLEMYHCSLQYVPQ